MPVRGQSVAPVIDHCARPAPASLSPEDAGDNTGVIAFAVRDCICRFDHARLIDNPPFTPGSLFRCEAHVTNKGSLQMLIIRDRGAAAVSAKRAASLADRFQRALEREAAGAGYELRSFEIQLDRRGSGPASVANQTLQPAGPSPIK
jgi:hypothetical protein